MILPGGGIFSSTPLHQPIREHYHPTRKEKPSSFFFNLIISSHNENERIEELKGEQENPMAKKTLIKKEGDPIIPEIK